MRIEIQSVELADLAMLSACIERIKRFYEPVHHHHVVPVVWVEEPERSGMIDYAIVLPYVGGGQMILHAIRRPGSAEVEFHS